jgi:hypothetical protein
LDFLFELDHARTYEEKRRILMTCGESPPRARYMLSSRFYCGSTAYDYEDWCYDWERLEKHIKSDDLDDYHLGDHLFCKPDDARSGPFRMWYQAHKNFWKKDVINHDAHAWLRRCGYVLWDHPETPLSDLELNERFDEARAYSLLDSFRRKDSVAKAKMRSSWRERAAIYKRGGRGYWDEGDLTRITWTANSPLPVRLSGNIEHVDQRADVPVDAEDGLD